MGWNGSTLSRHLVTPAHVKTRRGATALGASGQTQSALPCRPGNSLVAQGEVPSIGNGTMRQVFFTTRGIFFRAIADFPVPARKKTELRRGGKGYVIKCILPSVGVENSSQVEDKKHDLCDRKQKEKNHSGTLRIGLSPKRRQPKRQTARRKIVASIVSGLPSARSGSGCDGRPE